MPNYLDEMISEHRQVLDAVAAHDPDLAESHLRAHLRTVLREVPAHARGTPRLLRAAPGRLRRSLGPRGEYRRLALLSGDRLAGAALTAGCLDLGQNLGAEDLAAVHRVANRGDGVPLG